MIPFFVIRFNSTFAASSATLHRYIFVTPLINRSPLISAMRSEAPRPAGSPEWRCRLWLCRCGRPARRRHGPRADADGAAALLPPPASEFVRPTDRAAAAAPRLGRPSPSRAPHSAASCCTCISVWLHEVNEPNVSAVMFSVLDGDRLLSALRPSESSSSPSIMSPRFHARSPSVGRRRRDILYLERSVVSK